MYWYKSTAVACRCTAVRLYSCTSTAVRVPVQLQLLVSTAVPSNIGRSVDTSKFLFPCSMRAFCTATRTTSLCAHMSAFPTQNPTPTPYFAHFLKEILRNRAHSREGNIKGNSLGGGGGGHFDSAQSRKSPKIVS